MFPTRTPEEISRTNAREAVHSGKIPAAWKPCGDESCVYCAAVAEALEEQRGQKVP
jgi:hypothetical protein